MIGAGLAQAADGGRRRGARPPEGTQGVHRVGRGRPHPHAAVADGRGARADRPARPRADAQALRGAAARTRSCSGRRRSGPSTSPCSTARRTRPAGTRARTASAPARSRRASARCRRVRRRRPRRRAARAAAARRAAAAEAAGAAAASEFAAVERRPGGTSQGRSERLPTGPCPLHQECPAITCGRCHSKTTSVLELYNDEVTEGKRFPLSFCDSLRRCTACWIGMSVHLTLSTGRAGEEYRPRQGGEA